MKSAAAWILSLLVSMLITWAVSEGTAASVTAFLASRAVFIDSMELYPGARLHLRGMRFTTKSWNVELPSTRAGISLVSLLTGGPATEIILDSPALDLNANSSDSNKGIQSSSRNGILSDFLDSTVVMIHDGVIIIQTHRPDMLVAGCSGRVSGLYDMVLEGKTFAYKGQLGSWSGLGPMVELRNMAVHTIKVDGVTGKAPWSPVVTLDLSLTFTGPVMEADLSMSTTRGTWKAKGLVSTAKAKGFVSVQYSGHLSEFERFGIPLPKWLEGTFSGQGHIMTQVVMDEDGWRASSAFDLHELTISHPVVAPAPVTFRNIRGSASMTYRQETYTASVSMNSPVRLSAHWTRTNGEDTVDMTVPPSPCSGYLETLSPLLGPLSKMKVRGTIGWKMSFWRKITDWNTLRGSIQTIGKGCRVIADAPGFNLASLKGAIKVHLTDAAGRKTVRDLSPGSPQFYPLTKVPPHVVGAFMAAEDRRFFEHSGFDWPMMVRALGRDLAARRIVKGGSTITNQVVKNLYLGNQRTLERKLREALLTWRMEHVLSKRRIMELYLNIIEMGPGYRGIKEGALLYFKKTPSRLVPIEACHLALITRAPTYYYKYFKRGIVPDSWMAKIRRLLRRVYTIGSIDRTKYLEERSRLLVIQPLP